MSSVLFFVTDFAIITPHALEGYIEPQGFISGTDLSSNISHRRDNDTRTGSNTKNATMVNTLNFGDLQVPVPGFGAMGLSFALGSDLSLEEAEPVLLKAIELGCTFWDTAVRETIWKASFQAKLTIQSRSYTKLV